MSNDPFDLRPTQQAFMVMLGDPWTILCGAGTDEAPEDLTGATITAYGRPRGGERFELTVTPTDLTNGLFHVGIEAVEVAFDYAILIQPAGGQPLTRWRGSVTPTRGADDD